MSTAANCLYGSTLSPPRLLQVRQAVHAHMTACGGPNQDDLFKFHLPHIRIQMKEVLGLGWSETEMLWCGRCFCLGRLVGVVLRVDMGP
eukprot:5866090-Pyramimonas_sp.AAC.1